jgi:hypothetical protein
MHLIGALNGEFCRTEAVAMISGINLTSEMKDGAPYSGVNYFKISEVRLLELS